eukprot:947209_1
MPYSPTWNQLPTYFMQVTSVSEDVFHMDVLANVVSVDARRIFIKDMNRLKHQRILKTKKEEISWEIDIEISWGKSYRFALYESSQATEPIPYCTPLELTVLKDENQTPPYNATYKPNCIDLSTVFQVKDKQNKWIHIYWTLPPKSFGNISYKIIKDNDYQPDIISLLPYSIGLVAVGSIKSLRVITITEIEDIVYESNMSEPIRIEYESKINGDDVFYKSKIKDTLDIMKALTPNDENDTALINKMISKYGPAPPQHSHEYHSRSQTMTMTCPQLDGFSDSELTTFAIEIINDLTNNPTDGCLGCPNDAFICELAEEIVNNSDKMSSVGATTTYPSDAATVASSAISEHRVPFVMSREVQQTYVTNFKKTLKLRAKALAYHTGTRYPSTHKKYWRDMFLFMSDGKNCLDYVTFKEGIDRCGIKIRTQKSSDQNRNRIEIQQILNAIFLELDSTNTGYITIQAFTNMMMPEDILFIMPEYPSIASYSNYHSPETHDEEYTIISEESSQEFARKLEVAPEQKYEDVVLPTLPDHDPLIELQRQIELQRAGKFKRYRIIHPEELKQTIERENDSDLDSDDETY